MVGEMTKTMEMINTQKTTDGYATLTADAKAAWNAKMAEMYSMKQDMRMMMMEKAQERMIRFEFFSGLNNA